MDFNSITRLAAGAAYEMAGVGPAEIELIELHDCFATAELMHYENLGICVDGDAGALIDSGDLNWAAAFRSMYRVDCCQRDIPSAPPGSPIFMKSRRICAARREPGKWTAPASDDPCRRRGQLLRHPYPRKRRNAVSCAGRGGNGSPS